MKAALEYGLLFLTACFMLSLLIQFTSVVAQVHRAHLYLNYLTHLTENYDGQLVDVRNHASSQTICRECVYSHVSLDDRYQIDVHFPIRIPSIGYKEDVKIVGITTAFE